MCDTPFLVYQATSNVNYLSLCPTALKETSSPRRKRRFGSIQFVSCILRQEKNFKSWQNQAFPLPSLPQPFRKVEGGWGPSHPWPSITPHKCQRTDILEQWKVRALEMLVALPLGFLITEDFKDRAQILNKHPSALETAFGSWS